MKKFLLKLAQEYLLPVNTEIKNGDLVSPILNDDVIYEAIGIYYNFELKPFLFIRDDNGYIFSGPPDIYKRATKMTQLTLFS